MCSLTEPPSGDNVSLTGVSNLGRLKIILDTLARIYLPYINRCKCALLILSVTWQEVLNKHLCGL